MMLSFRASDLQIQQIIALAVNASVPMGMGHVHYKGGDYKPEDFALPRDSNVVVDYFQGRMVKLYLGRVDEGLWRIRDDIDIEYQSWARVYPTAKELLWAAFVEEIEEVN